jgi:DNA-binding GntR family transcriptional regulator
MASSSPARSSPSATSPDSSARVSCPCAKLCISSPSNRCWISPLPVPVLTVEKFTEIGEVRILLESHITRLAAQRADAADIERIEAANREFLSAKASRDPTLLLRRNREFHFAIYGAAHHTTLMSLIEPLWVRCGPCMLALFEDLGVEEIKKGASSPHRAVLQALKAGRETEAAQAIAIDIRATIDRFRLHVETVQAIDPSSLLAKPAKERA